ncbi:hypothetical protein RRG08_030585 [Elysia crispata]|uniref:Uncharacterized protein n=1 Tax=Elysia crispata TaxID=231223 RepID=A0AAE1DAH9_9GAST|nr:hypothetical protein RRG08_030585 [Elysia crispata]
MEDDDSDSEGKRRRKQTYVRLIALRISQSRYGEDRPLPPAHRHNQSTLSSAGWNQRVTGGVCFRCGRQGHFARVCAQESNSDFSVSPASCGGYERRVTKGVTPRGQAHSRGISTDYDEGRSDRKVIGSRVTGMVKWFNVKRGFGFITHDGTREDIFAHHSSIVSRYAANIDELNPRHHANRLVDNLDRDEVTNADVLVSRIISLPDRPEVVARRNLCSGRRFLQRDQDYQPRTTTVGSIFMTNQGSPCSALILVRRGDNPSRRRHATDVTQQPNI